MDSKLSKNQDPLHNELHKRGLDKEREFERLAAANKVAVAEYYQDHDEGKHVYLRGEYYVNVDTLYHELAVKVEESDLAPEELPEYCWGCKPRIMSEHDVDDMIRCGVENMHEGAIDEICPSSIRELRQALKQFYLHNHHVWSWACDFSTAVLLDRSAFKRSPELDEDDEEEDD